MYSLEYRMMVQVLRQLGFSGEFHANIPHHTALKGGGQAVLSVKNGDIISCFILGKSGQKIHHDAEAQRLLSTLGILDWEEASSTSNKTASPATSPLARSASPATPPPARSIRPVERNRQAIPQRLAVPEARFHSWSTLEKSVYSLADGTRSIEQIAQTLSRPVMTIEQVIHNFEAIGVMVH